MMKTYSHVRRLRWTKQQQRCSQSRHKSKSYAPTVEMKITFELLRQGRPGGFGRLVLERV
jgi:hypothetical protein